VRTWSSDETGNDAEAAEETQSLLLEHGGRLEDRYEVLSLLGEGGMGEVHLAKDRNLGREVAIKTIPPHRMDSRRLARFVAEARITAQLEHPGIVPVHDLFLSSEGDIFYTMKRVQGMTLRQVLADLEAEDPETVKEWNLNRLLTVFRGACQAVAYAHTRRVVHRDLKPDNLMIGAFGEVLVMDWGVARMLDDAPEELVEVLREGASLLQTADGAMVGSPAYMSPEQMHANAAELSPASDVFSLGVILYEILTLRRPFRAPNLGRLLYLVAKGEFVPPSEAASGRELPEDVEAICLRALSVDPADRFADAGELTRELGLWLDRVRPREQADKLVAEGREKMLLFAKAASDAEEAELRARSLQAGLESWDPLSMKRLVWDAERKAADSVAHADTLFGDCEAAFESALSHVSDYPPALIGVAALYWIRFLQAEEVRDVRWQRRWKELILRYAPERYAGRLQGDGTLTLHSVPEATTVTLHRLVEEDGRLVAGPRSELGATPLAKVPVQMGRYELRLEAAGRASLRVPVVVRRSQNLDLKLTLPPTGAVPEGFVAVPASHAYLGGDSAAISGLPEIDVFLHDFAIAQYPVTVAAWLQYLEALQSNGQEGEALLRSPRARGNRGVRQEPLFQLPSGGSHSLPFIDRDGTTWHAEQPIVSINHDDAAAYAVWLTGRSDHNFRLPTESEWEKAARGLDRRIFPWGGRFDSSFCVMSESSPDAPDLPAIGAVPTDVSPYGVRDLAGGVRDWCDWDPEADPMAGRYPIRGGSYGTVEIYCRCASRSVVELEYVGSHVGFRLVVDL
jgi:serine/threonine-protein kinase